MNPIPTIQSLNTTPTHSPRTQTPTQAPQTTTIALQTQKVLTIPISDNEFPLDPFDITPTHSPPPSLKDIPDLSDNDPIFLRKISKPQSPRDLFFLPPSKAAAGTHNLILLSLFQNLAPTLNPDVLFPC